MAITIEENLPEFNPVYNLCEIAVSSTNVAQPGFQFLFEVTVEGETAKQFRVLPEPSFNYGIASIHRYLETFVKPEFGEHVSTTCFEYSDETIKKFSILYLEEWLVGGLPVIGEDTLQGGDLYVWEASFRHHDWINERIDADPFLTWICNAGNGGREFLTKQKTKKVRLTDYGWTWFMTDTPNDCKKLQIKTYDSSGALIDTYRISNLLTTTPTKARLQRVMSAPAILNTVTVGQFDLGAQPIFDDTVDSYTIQLVTAANAPASEILTFEIQTECRYDVVRLHFENELGGYDAYNFTFRNQSTEEFERKSFFSNPYRVISGGLSYKHEDHGAITHYVKGTTKTRIRSEYLTDDEMNWLRELRKSTSVYLEFTDSQGATNFKPVKEVGGNWTEELNELEKLVQVEMDITMSWEDFSQRK